MSLVQGIGKQKFLEKGRTKSMNTSEYWIKQIILCFLFKYIILILYVNNIKHMYRSL